eukprot:TRINITY_DN61256_c0_g1_i1.p1 TRINITY_DN61256_c0_g1~~TRINITY_DN61256_c0_g1_i1.p1  ORF type:complete len:240 (+),score=46.82 TRINITY_DN61256_c0_g1_i1:27-746(+)
MLSDCSNPLTFAARAPSRSASKSLAKWVEAMVDNDQWEEMIKHQAKPGEGPGPGGEQLVLTLYRDGFTVGDGPFRPSADPANRKFLDEVIAGRLPEELGPGDRDVAINDKRGEDYKEPGGGMNKKPKATDWASLGAGNSLGGASSSAAAVAVSAESGTVAVDESKPKTKIQIRFHDGQRKAQEFNQDQTVGDLRAFCSQCLGGVSVTVMGGFPPKPLTDDGKTLKDADLLGAAVTARPA